MSVANSVAPVRRSVAKAVRDPLIIAAIIVFAILGAALLVSGSPGEPIDVSNVAQQARSAALAAQAEAQYEEVQRVAEVAQFERLRDVWQAQQGASSNAAEEAWRYNGSLWADEAGVVYGGEVPACTNGAGGGPSTPVVC